MNFQENRSSEFVNKYLGGLILFIFVCISLYVLFHHVPNFDEVNAWNISSTFDLFNIFSLIKYEGHQFLWFWILRPFAKYNFGFPYSLQLLNWVFCFGALIIMWKKAPFNGLTKSFLTLGMPALMYSTYARNYAIGLFFLAIVCSLYKNSLKHPIVYSLLLLLLGNINVFFTIPAFWFAVIFVYELWKERTIPAKSKLCPVFILLFCGFLLFFQYKGVVLPYYQEAFPIKYNLEHIYVLFIEGKYPLLILYSLLFIFSFKMFNKKMLLYFVGSSLMFLIIAIFFYAIHSWHSVLLYVYLLSACWINSKFGISLKLQGSYNLLLTCFCGFLMLYPCCPGRNGIYLGLNNYIISHNARFNNSKIFIFPMDSALSTMIPDLKKYNINFYDAHCNKILSKDHFYEQWQKSDNHFEKMVSMFEYDNTEYVALSNYHPHEGIYTEFNELYLGKPRSFEMWRIYYDRYVSLFAIKKKPNKSNQAKQN